MVKPEGVVAIVFAHTDVEAWERFLRALRAAKLVVTTSWPMRSEREARSTAQISAVLGSSVVLVCRPTSIDEKDSSTMSSVSSKIGSPSDSMPSKRWA